MIIKYLSFVIGLMWSYSLIRTHSIFNKKSALIFKLLISKVSWLTFIAGCYFGYKNFSIKATLIGITIAVIIVHLGFHFSGAFLKALFRKVRARFRFLRIISKTPFLVTSGSGPSTKKNYH